MKIKKYGIITLLTCSLLSMILNFNNKLDDYFMGYAVGVGIGLVLLAAGIGFVTYFVTKKNNDAASIAVVIVSILGLFGQIQQAGMISPRKNLDRYVLAGKKELPKKVDEVTILKDIRIVNNDFIYEYEIMKDFQLNLTNEVKEEFIKKSRADVQMKMDKIYKLIKKAELKLKFRYLQNGQLILEFEI